MGPRPGGQLPATQILWRDGARVAYLYRVDLALPVRPMTPARQRALDKAMKARRTCPRCGVTYEWCLQLRKLGSCRPCYDRENPVDEAPEDPGNPMIAYWNSLPLG